MKKILQVLLLVVVSTCAVRSSVTAQLADKNYFVSAGKIKQYLEFEEKLKAENAFDPKDALKAAKANFRALKANNRAAENFRKQFKDATGVNWIVEKDAIVGSFTKEDTRTNVVYNRRGNWIHTLSYQNEKTMPENVRSTVENAYPGYDISLCVEIHESNLLFYIVQIENKKTFKQLGVYEGEINEISEYRKNQ